MTVMSGLDWLKLVHGQEGLSDRESSGREASAGECASGECSGRLSAAVFELLPCMAVILRAGDISGLNRLARRLTGLVVDPFAKPVRIEEVLSQASSVCAPEPQDRRVRFDGVLLGAGGASLRVSAAATEIQFEGESCTLLLMMEAAAPDGLYETRVEDLLEAMPRATVVTHAGRVVRVNSEFLQMFGYALDDVLGHVLDDLVLPDGQLNENELIRYQLGRTGRSAFDTQRRTRDGRLLEVHVMVSRLRLGSGAGGLFIVYRPIERSKPEAEPARQSPLHDPLTGLANRILFVNRTDLMLSRMRRDAKRRFAVMLLDLDGLGGVNEALGHAAGNAVLLEVAHRLQQFVRPRDTLGHMDGDKFAFLRDQVGSRPELEQFASRLQAEAERVIEVHGERAFVSATIGIVVAHVDSRNGEAMLRDAMAAASAAKGAGGRGIVLVGAEDVDTQDGVEDHAGEATAEQC